MMSKQKELTFDEFDGFEDYDNEPQYEYKPNNAYERSMQSKPIDTRIWLIKGEWIDRFTPVAKQLFIVALFFLGFYGTWLALGSFLSAFLSQASLTAFQWANRKRKGTVWYLTPLLIDCTLTLIGYREHVYQSVFNAWASIIKGIGSIYVSISNGNQWSAGTIETTATSLSWLFIIIVSIYIAYAPESLVDG